MSHLGDEFLVASQEINQLIPVQVLTVFSFTTLRSYLTALPWFCLLDCEHSSILPFKIYCVRELIGICKGPRRLFNHIC